ncbi:MAG: hypothetical protein Q8807_04125, partial ['Waltheria sp.' little leaf phytoplasma]|nr:hypothetical protein ['Waltheria sp.' little leaf phytoplasma]
MVKDKEAFWNIGSGETIDIWRDKWLRTAPLFRATHVSLRSPRCQLVSSLIDPGTKQWKIDELWRLFTPEDVDRIVHTPISARGGPDKLIWHHASNGDYWVKSGYKVARAMVGREEMGGNEREPWWSLVWKAKISPKIRHFF